MALFGTHILRASQIWKNFSMEPVFLPPYLLSRDVLVRHWLILNLLPVTGGIPPRAAWMGSLRARLRSNGW